LGPEMATSVASAIWAMVTAFSAVVYVSSVAGVPLLAGFPLVAGVSALVYVLLVTDVHAVPCAHVRASLLLKNPF
jgi:hypothetical protein